MKIKHTKINNAKVPRNAVYVNFAGVFNSKVCFITVNAHSKWLEVEMLVTTHQIIKVLSSIFYCYRLHVPDQLISDIGT